MTSAPSQPAHTGVYGGTFDPIHLGHLRAAEEVVEALGLERMIFIPSATPPHKGQRPARDPMAPAERRTEWVRRAIDDNPRFEVDELEIQRDGPSFTVDTLRVLAERTGGELPVFVIGSDAFRELGTWREPRTVLTLAHFAVTTRPPTDVSTLDDWLPGELRDEVEVASDGRSARHRRADTWLRQVELTALDISSSAIRARLRAGESIRYLVPKSVHEAICESGCYREEPAEPLVAATGSEPRAAER